MDQTIPLTGSEAARTDEPRRSEIVIALHLAALRRQFDVIRAIFGNDPPHRSREGLWVVLEVLLAELRGERIAVRDLVARAGRLLSAPTLSRVVADLEREGFLVSETAGRLKLLRPTTRTLDILAARSDDAFAALTGILGESSAGTPTTS